MNREYSATRFKLLVILSLFLILLATSGPAAADENVVFLPMVTQPAAEPESTTRMGDVIMTVNAPGPHPQGLAWDGQKLWVASTAGLMRMDPQTGEADKALSSPGSSPQGLTWDGQYLWVVSFDTKLIYQMDIENSQVLNSFAAPADQPVGLAWDGELLWHSDLGGAIYRLDPDDGSIVEEFANPFGQGTSLLEWDGSQLWVSARGNLYRFDVNQDSVSHSQNLQRFAVDQSEWEITRTIPDQAELTKGLAWDDGNLWNGGPYDAELFLIDATADGAEVSGRVLKNDQPLAGKYVEIWQVMNEANDILAGISFTDAAGEVTFTLDPETDYLYLGGGDETNNEMYQWARYFTTKEMDQVPLVLPDIDVYAPPTIEPAADATMSVSTLSPSSPLIFKWTAKDGASGYQVYIRNTALFETFWKSELTTKTETAFDGTTLQGTPIEPGDYRWYVVMTLPGDWKGGSQTRQITFTP
jgi:streptogramin lyase